VEEAILLATAILMDTQLVETMGLRLNCMFILWADKDSIVPTSICGDKAISLHVINLKDLGNVIGVPTCEHHDQVMNGTVLLHGIDE